MSKQCPSESDLQSFLDESLDQATTDSIANHLETCLACQTKLEMWLSASGQDLTHETMDIDNTVERLIGQISSQPPETPTSQSHAGKTFGHYSLIEQIGQGTTGVVYRADDLKLKRQVAVKVLRSDFANSERARTRLEREARAAASIRHPNVVDVFDVCIDPVGISYLVMELVEGGTLREKLRNSKTIPAREAAEIARELLNGLAAAHDQGLVHRDLKCSNVLIQRETGITKLTDFGLVRVLDSDSKLTRENVIAGTPAYMSPEQIQTPDMVDHRADIYSLGVLLYQLLAGELPFRGVDRMVLQQVLYDNPPSVRRQNDTISRDLETVCLKAMSKNPEARYVSAALMEEDLQRWLDGKPIKARRIGVLGRVWNWSKRNPMVASLSALSLSLLTLLAIGSSVAALSLRAAGLETERHSIAAKRQRDQSLETLRELIFDVNELLEPGKAEDLDDVQAKLLAVALQGIEKIDMTAEDAGLLDVSVVAAKNRLGDVYMRLEKFDLARQQFLASVETANKLKAQPEDEEFIVRERLRSYEGLASLAMFADEETDAELYCIKAEEFADRLSDLTGEEYFPEYYVNVDFLLSDEEAAAALLELREQLKVPAELPSDIEDAYLETESLGWHYLETDDLEKAEEVYQSLLLWLDSFEPDSPKPRFSRTHKIAKHVAMVGLASVAEYGGNAERQIEMLRKAVGVLPKGSGKRRFHNDAVPFANDAIIDLISELETMDSEPWMLTYYADNNELAKIAHKRSSMDRWLEFDAYIAKAKYIYILKELGKEETAKPFEAELRETLSRLDTSKIPEDEKSELLDVLGWTTLK